MCTLGPLCVPPAFAPLIRFGGDGGLLSFNGCKHLAHPQQAPVNFPMDTDTLRAVHDRGKAATRAAQLRARLAEAENRRLRAELELALRELEKARAGR